MSDSSTSTGVCRLAYQSARALWEQKRRFCLSLTDFELSDFEAAERQASAVRFPESLTACWIPFGRFLKVWILLKPQNSLKYLLRAQDGDWVPQSCERSRVVSLDHAVELLARFGLLLVFGVVLSAKSFDLLDWPGPRHTTKIVLELERYWDSQLWNHLLLVL